MHKIIIYTIVFFNAYILSAQLDTVISIQQITIESDKDIIIQPPNEFSIEKEVFENTPSQSVAEASSWTPGVYLQDYGGIGGLKTISSKGLSSNYTGVFLNGTKVENTLATQIDLGNFDLVGCSSITVSHNSSKNKLKPASFYIAPTNITINMSPVDSNFYMFGYKTGSFGLINPFISYAAVLNTKNSIVLNASYTHANGEYPFEYKNGTTIQRATRFGSDVKRINTYFSHKYLIRDSVEVESQIRSNYNDQGLPGAVVLYNSDSRKSLKSNDLQISSNIINTKNRLNWRTGVNFSQSTLTYLDTSYFNSVGFLKQKYDQYAYTSSSSISFKMLPKTTITSALDYSLGLLRRDKTIDRVSSIFEIGIEQKLNRLRINGFYLIQNISDKRKDVDSYTNYSSSGGVSFDYYPFDKSPLKLYSSVGKYIRNPNFQELYYQRVLGELNPEKTTSTQLGLNFFNIYRERNITWSADLKYFNNSVEHKIISTPTQNLFVWSIQNLGKVEVKGVESIVSFSIKSDSLFSFYYSNSYTFQNVKDITDKNKREYGHQIAYTPFDISKHIFLFKRKNSVLTLSSMFNGIRYSLGENIEENLLPSWWVHNISMSQLFMLKDKELSVQIQLNNILNSQYQIIKNFPMPGRYWYLTTTLSI